MAILYKFVGKWYNAKKSDRQKITLDFGLHFLYNHIEEQ